MNDTRETLVSNLTIERMVTNNEFGQDIPKSLRPVPRFKAGDKVRMALRPDEVIKLQRSAYWDYEFQGWLIAPGLIGVHECNYILADELDLWEPHPDGLWSWWTLKNANPPC